MENIKYKQMGKINGGDMTVYSDEEIVFNIAREGYKNYVAYASINSSVTEFPLPKWKELPIKIKNSWLTAATGMINYIVVNKLDVTLINK